MAEPDTLHAALAAAVRRRPGTPVTFHTGRETLSLGELLDQSHEVAGALAEAGVRRGDRVGLLCQNEADFFRVLIGLGVLGACACPFALPTTARDGYQERIASIIAAAGIRTVVLSERLARLRGVLGSALDGITEVSTANLRGAHADPPASGVTGDDDLIVQFTSGSTSAPKGVRLTHANVLACLNAIGGGIELTDDDDAGNWLPLFHDMGLFGSLAALNHPIPLTVWQPSVFVKDPAHWLRTMSEAGITACPMPNFAYDALARAVPEAEVADYDLSRWRVAFNGAEPIAVDTLEGFLDHFAAAGFRPESMLPVYGLAEATLPVTFSTLHAPPHADWVDRARLAATGEAVAVARNAPGARGVVSVGRPVARMNVRVTDPDTGVPLAERVVGEVEIRGASVTPGYLRGEQPFTADGWLRTGDLGYLAGGELHITGRRKEMIIVRGDNYYPEDVEAAVRTDPAVHRRRCVAYLDEAAERMVLVVESTAPDTEELRSRLRARVGAATGLDDVRVVVAGPQAIPRTSSGKLQRLASRSRFG
ncbi:AMP-binding protein [Actinokineospora cianjurensis]|uniref:Acyl-CoA synthetase (AMP-forming)/AMP-acid ligase II n=1 Tax=Actinokineospora cianjurensis TaxID=585224 RepID=A0A421B199_9PSEU|nr:AMP-binding protein [Actinokineospora cianjurensis]RLK58140.1 acyl-CoA synthetase (AMP-forming)/AMP-acid ligase II [Actinokineospora cianjurensis]